MTGPVRPSGILQPERVRAEVEQPGMSPMTGQPGQPDIQQLMMLLMMLMQGGGMGQGMGAPTQPPVGAPPVMDPAAGGNPMGAALMGGMGGP